MAARRRSRCGNRWRRAPSPAPRPMTRRSPTWFAGRLGETTPKTRAIVGWLAETLRYGENPHQSAAFYRIGRAALRRRHRRAGAGQGALLQQSQRHRRGLRAGRRVRSQGQRRRRHHQACQSLRRGDRQHRSRKPTPRRCACDPVSAFGGIVALNRTLDADAAREIVKIFTEVIIAPDASDEAKAILAEKKNLRLLLAGGLPDPKARGLDLPLARRRFPRAVARQRRDRGRRSRS